MTAFLWFCVVWWALDAIIYVARVGKTIGPITPGMAVFNVLFYGGLIFWAFSQAN